MLNIKQWIKPSRTLYIVLMILVVAAVLLYALMLLVLITDPQEVQITGNPSEVIAMDWNGFVKKHGKLDKEKKLPRQIAD